MTQIKMLYYDYSGFRPISRKLAKGHFRITEHEDGNFMEIERNKLERLVEGMAYEYEFIPPDKARKVLKN